MEDINTQSEQPKKSVMSRLSGIFFEPGSIYKYLDQKPDLSTALIITILAAMITSIAGVILQFRNPEFIANMNKMPEQTAAVMKYGAPIIGAVFGVIFGLIMFFIYAGIIHVIAPFLDGKSTFKKLIVVLGYANAPMILFAVLMLVFALINTNSHTPFTASLGLILTREKVGITMNAFYSKIDLFAFWSMFLSILGLSAIYKFGWKKATAIVVILWMIGLGIQVGITKAMEPLIKQSQQNQQTQSEEN